jgi:hypothetical protein
MDEMLEKYSKELYEDKIKKEDDNDSTEKDSDDENITTIETEVLTSVKALPIDEQDIISNELAPFFININNFSNLSRLLNIATLILRFMYVAIFKHLSSDNQDKFPTLRRYYVAIADGIYDEQNTYSEADIVYDKYTALGSKKPIFTEKFSEYIEPTDTPVKQIHSRKNFYENLEANKNNVPDLPAMPASSLKQAKGNYYGQRNHKQSKKNNSRMITVNSFLTPAIREATLYFLIRLSENFI